MEKKKFKLGLVPKLIIAIIIGILFGQFLPTGFCRFVVTLSGFFSTYLKFIIPLMILAYVTMGIADLSQGAGQLLFNYRCSCLWFNFTCWYSFLPCIIQSVPTLYDFWGIRSDCCDC